MDDKDYTKLLRNNISDVITKFIKDDFFPITQPDKRVYFTKLEGEIYKEIKLHNNKLNIFLND